MPRVPPSAIGCRYCPALATGTVSAHGGGLKPLKVPHCDEHWGYAYEMVRVYPSRTWTMITQPDVLF